MSSTEKKERKMVDFGNFVHQHEGTGRWVVAQYRDGRFYAPMTRESRRLTGCNTVYGSLDYCLGNAYHYKRRADALRRARELYG
jgi:hypothetical protein